MTDQPVAGPPPELPPESPPEPQSPGRPDPNLTTDQLQKARQWLVDHWNTTNCPFHGPTGWNLESQMALAPVFTPGVTILGGPIYPFLVVTCSQCGFTVFVNAIKAGIVSSSPTPSEQAADTPAAKSEDK